MRITVLAQGTRGDVFPLTALAAELARHGHRVRVAASPNLVDTPRRLGLEAVTVGWNTQRALESPLGQEWVNATDADTFFRVMYQIGAEYGERMDDEVLDACADSEAVVSGVLTEWRAAAVTEARGIPHIVHDFYPRRPNDAVANPLTYSGQPLNPELTLATYRGLAQQNWRYLRGPLTRFRRRLGLPPLPPAAPARPPLEIQGYSSALFPGLTWGPYRPFVGDLRMTPADLDRLGMSDMDPELVRWLGAGDPPALVTFGSTYTADPAALVATVGRVCRSLGLRGLLVTGWGLAGAEPAAGPDLRLVSYLDYDVVLPRCAMVVHHGSATVTMAGIRAGLPTMVCSAAFDQPVWGRQLEWLGAGVHARFADLTEDVLRSGMRRLMAEPVRRRAAELGERVRAEPHGTLAAADEVDKYLVAQPGWGR